MLELSQPYNMIILLILIFFASCAKTEVIEAPMTKSIDTVVVKARPKPHRPQVDTTRVPIGFDPSVEDWEEYIPPVVEYTEEELLEEAKKK